MDRDSGYGLGGYGLWLPEGEGASLSVLAGDEKVRPLGCSCEMTRGSVQPTPCTRLVMTFDWSFEENTTGVVVWEHHNSRKIDRSSEQRYAFANATWNRAVSCYGALVTLLNHLESAERAYFRPLSSPITSKTTLLSAWTTRA